MVDPLSPSPLIESIIRVNHAGEFGAKRIYEGQLSVIKDPKERALIQEMLSQEEEHLTLFTNLADSRNVPPTKLLPLWNMIGFGLGALSAALGGRAAMAATVAVEEVIDEHYQNQLAQLRSIRDDYEEPLQALIEKCHADEIAHKDIALEQKAQEMPAFPFFKALLKTGVRLAIAVSKRV